VFPAGAELATELRDTVLLKGETAQVKKVPVGDRFWTFACVAVPSPEGQPGGVLAVGQDVTEEVTQSRQLEEELESLRAQAEARMRELEADTDRVRGERRELLEDIRVRGATLLGVADAADEREPDEAGEPEPVDEIERAAVD